MEVRSVERMPLHHEALVEYSWDVRSGVARFGYENPRTLEIRAEERAQLSHWITPEQREALRREKGRITGEAKRRQRRGGGRGSSRRDATKPGWTPGIGTRNSRV